MNFPDDLPPILFYRVGSTSRPTLPRTPVNFVGSGGCTNAARICPEIPLGTTGWKLSGESAWRPLSSLPRHWLPFLNRARQSAMDPRPQSRGTPAFAAGMLPDSY